ncbi:ComF family protein [Novosphingobium sp. KACC 22771]|uniref:ComF family protein n=1 Tax=Novosphingobium sp. KACC 22771 TaxID=3025670 RepID=UPI002366731C|nr:ComF family protein [Novosphingobium sp. KACC 22771]WDF71621.1 ComF family protein [Novosphingobium sp. KACC 22771]
MRRLSPVLDLLFPPRCPLCGEGVHEQGGLCAACWSGLAMPGDPACRMCQRPFSSEAASHAHDDLLCHTCVVEAPRHHGVAAATLYNDTSRQLVIALKHGRRVALAGLMGRLMAARLRARDVGPGWLVVPVPLHRWRLWGRGFNQSALLAQEIARHTGARPMVDALVRRRKTPMLGGLGPREREKVLTGAIALHPARKARLHGAKVILADDVLTSGATTNACIAALEQAGAARVIVACFARVHGEALP